MEDISGKQQRASHQPSTHTASDIDAAELVAEDQRQSDSCNRKSERQENKGNVHLTERQYGHFYRAIPLPEGAKVEEARANFVNGLLEVTVPVQEQKEKRREIPIEAGAPAQSGAPGKAA